MGGVIGAMSTKFVVAAGTLLLSARVGNHPVRAILDPAAETTLISPSVAGPGRAQSDGVTIDRPQWIGLDAHMLRIQKLTVSTSIPQDSVLGADVLNAAPLLLDFKTHRLQIMEPGSFRRTASTMEALPIATSSEGCLTIAGLDERGLPVSAAFFARPQGRNGGSQTVFHVGSIKLTASQSSQSTCGSSKLQIDWGSFESRKIIFDLDHRQILIGPL
jgi:hypothetical protein